MDTASIAGLLSVTPSESQQITSPAFTTEGAKRKRIGRACDFCNRRAIKCVPNVTEGRCQSCINFGIDKCTYDRPAKKRGPPKAKETGVAKGASRALASSGTVTASAAAAAAVSANLKQEEDTSQLTEFAPLETILQLLDIFYSAVYPIFPYVHYPRFKSRVQAREYTQSKAFYAAVMALCALTSARIRDKAVFSEQIQDLPKNLPSSDTFFTAAANALPKDLVDETEFDYMRASGLLALTALQNGQPMVMRQYFSRTHALASILNLDDESRWLPASSYIENEERRRVFWSIYHMDIYACVIWGGTVRVKESQASVSYPTEVNDEYISNSEPYITPQPEGTTSWIKGWNKVTDMYRVLEYSLDRFRAAQLANQTSPTMRFRKNQPWATVEEIYDQLDSIYHSLPPIFKDLHPKTAAEDIYLFQSTNVIVTWHTAKMVAIGADDLDVLKRCQVINDLLGALSGVPPAYFACMSCPLLFHLVGIVQVLGNIITGPLSLPIFKQVRTALLRMAELLGAIENRLSFTAGASERLRDQVARLDQYMHSSNVADAFSKPSSYIDLMSDRNPANLIAPVSTLSSFTTAAPMAPDSTSPATVTSLNSNSPDAPLAALWGASSSNAPVASTSISSGNEAMTVSATSNGATTELEDYSQMNDHSTIQLPDSLLQPFSGDFSQSIFPQWSTWNYPSPAW